MKFHEKPQSTSRVSLLLLALSMAACLTSCSKAEAPAFAKGKSLRPAKVEIRSAAGKFQLYVNQQSFYVKAPGWNSAVRETRRARREHLSHLAHRKMAGAPVSRFSTRR